MVITEKKPNYVILSRYEILVFYNKSDLLSLFSDI